MAARKVFLSFLLSLIFTASSAINLDVNSANSIKATARTLAGAIVDVYNGQNAGFTPGLFDIPIVRDEVHFWEAGAIWTSLIEYSHLTGDSQHDDLIATALEFQVGEQRNYMPKNQTMNITNDDQSRWALAALTAAEVGFKKPQSGEWLDLAKTVFDNQVLRWDTERCNGGLRFHIFESGAESSWDMKDSVSNGGFFLLGARLARLTGNESYYEWADRSFKWSQDVGLIGEDYLVYNVASLNKECSVPKTSPWLQSHAIFAEGAAVMFSLTDEPKWKDAVSGFAISVKAFQAEGTSILSDDSTCEKNGSCAGRLSPFTGIAASAYARAVVAASTQAGDFYEMLQASAKGAAQYCHWYGADMRCGKKWDEEDLEAPTAVDGGLGRVFSALEVVQALLRFMPESTSTETSPTPTASGSHKGSADRVQMDQSLSGIVFKGHVVQGMLFREPTLRPERSAVMEVSRAASEGEVGKMNDDLAV
ncbi:glycosyl hydrolase family 76-domain-containing protein [Massariosphaeria phaeospora]|uniref:Mannan endo-1,6-alpha-mannosidase n=1 Tax=Massariosphaeria phaeospora TaxID=100035 RepID=A0A7C8IPI4_9PLEO|nr:glycosyl hydrolase family 76-domain-containing protein [Massariosphaeria phaeospora]